MTIWTEGQRHETVECSARKGKLATEIRDTSFFYIAYKQNFRIFVKLGKKVRSLFKFVIPFYLKIFKKVLKYFILY